MEEQEELRKAVERKVDDLSKAKINYESDVAVLREEVDKVSNQIVATKVKNVEELQLAVEEATTGVEELLKRERAKHDREKRVSSARSAREFALLQNQKPERR